MELNENVQIVLNEIENSGYEAYVVGGATRDFLLGKIINDYDVCTNALPNKIQEIFAKYHCILNGLKHGTVSVVINKEVIEITTYRNDGDYQDHRHPKNVSFVNNLFEDIQRRDFTINGLAYNPKTNVIDYVGGQKDLNDGIIRAIGNPNKRFNEDALRILRGIRLSAQLGFEIEKETNAAIFKNKDLLKDVAIERKIMEFNKILLSDLAKQTINDYSEIFNIKIVTEIKDNDDLEQRLAIILLDNNLDIDVLRKMKYPNKTVGLVKKYITNIDSKTDYINLCRLKSIFEDDLFKLLDLKKRYNKDFATKEEINKIDIYKISQLDISGDKLKCDNNKKGKTLQLLLEKVIKKELNNTEKELLDYLKENEYEI